MALDIDRVTRIIEETAATEVRPRFRALAEGDVREKAGGDLVTVADEAAEAELARRLAELLPDSVVLGEEAAARDVAVLARLADSAPVWVIDPVDGTGNFARGNAVFAVMVALVQHGETRAAWIHEPMRPRTGWAVAGEGAYLDGARLTMALPPADPARLEGTLHASQHGGRALRQRLERRRGRVTATRSLRCAGAEYLRMAEGRQHFSLFTKLAPWDHAPGTLILTEAGGVARLIDGRPYAPALTDGEALLLAPDPESWTALYDRLLADPPPADRTNAADGAGA